MVTLETEIPKSESKIKTKNEVVNKMQLPTTSTASSAAANAASTSAGCGQSSNGSSYRQQRAGRNSKGLPASAVSAAPYVPPAYQQTQPTPAAAPAGAEFVHQHHHVAYGYEAPPPPMGQPPPPTWVTPYYFDGAAAPGPHGYAVPHMCTMPPPPAATSAGAGQGKGGGRVTPSTTSVTSAGGSEQPQSIPSPYEVEYHLHSGEHITFPLGDGRVEIIAGKPFSRFP